MGKKQLLISPDNQYIIALGSDTSINIWHLATGQLSKTIKTHTQPIIGLGITLDGKTLIMTTQDKNINVLNWQTGQLERTLIDHDLENITLSPDGNYIISSGGHLIKIWNLQNGQLEDTVKNTESESSISSSISGNSIRISGAIASKNMKIKEVVVSPDGRIFVIGVNSKNIKVWKLQN